VPESPFNHYCRVLHHSLQYIVSVVTLRAGITASTLRCIAEKQQEGCFEVTDATHDAPVLVNVPVEGATTEKCFCNTDLCNRELSTLSVCIV